MIREHSRLAEETSAECNTGSIKLRKVHVDDVMLHNKFCGNKAKSGSDNTFADARRHRHPDDFHTIHDFFAWQ